MWHCKMVFVLLLANGAAGLPWLLLTNRATLGLIPFRNGRNPAGFEAPPPPRRPLALVGRVASTGSICGTYVLLTSRLGLAATKAAQGRWTPPPAFWSTVSSVVSIVPLSVVLGVFALGLKITSAENTALITSRDTDRQRELMKMDTERKVGMTRMETERKTEMTRMDTERKTEMTQVKTELKDMLASNFVDLKAEMTQMKTELKDTLASNLVELKTANAAEVERLVTSKIADQRLVSADDQAQVAMNIDAAVDRLNATTIQSCDVG